MIKKIINFITVEIWRIPSASLSATKSFFLNQTRVIILSLRGFSESKCSFRASALTFFTLLSVVPVIAILFAIARGFGYQMVVQNYVVDKLQNHPDIAQNIINFANSYLETIKGGAIAFVGIIILLWITIKLLSNVEISFNDIWGIKKQRGFANRISNYLTVILVCPVLIIASSSLTVFINTKIQALSQNISLVNTISPFIFSILKLTPYCLVWLLFIFIYFVVPNTRVNIKSALCGGLIAGTIYQITQFIYIRFQIGVSNFNAIYGSFAALPLFLVWIQVSWLIVLLGAEISFAHQNVHTYEFEPDCLNISNSFKLLLTLGILRLLVKNFQKHEPPWPAEHISDHLGIPIRLTRQILQDLTGAGLISLCSLDGEEKNGYQPGQDPDLLTISYITETLNQHGNNHIEIIKFNELQNISAHLETLRETVKHSPANVLLKNI